MAQKIRLTDEQAFAKEKKQLLIIDICGWVLTVGSVAGILLYAFVFGGGGGI